MEEIRALGFEPEDYDDEPPVEVWPDNWLAWRLFMSLSTQWTHVSTGMGAPIPTGLHYPSLYPLLDRECPAPDDWRQTLQDVQACEDAALSEMRKKR